MTENLFNIGNNPLSINPPCPCVFYSDKYNTCDFDFLQKYLSRKRVSNCPRGISKNGYSYKFFGYAVLGELEHNGGKMNFENICDILPFLKPRVVLKILQKLRRNGKILKKCTGRRSELDSKNVWKLGNSFGGCSR